MASLRGRAAAGIVLRGEEDREVVEVPEQQLQQFGHLVTPHLEPGERVLDIASAQSARASMEVMLGLAGAAGQAIVDRAAGKMGEGTIAKTFLSGSRPLRRSCCA